MLTRKCGAARPLQDLENPGLSQDCARNLQHSLAPSLQGLIPGSCLQSGSPHPSLPVSPANAGSESTRSTARTSSAVTTCCEFAGFGPASASLPGSSRRVYRPLAGKPPSVAPLIYSCGGGGWRTSKSSSDVCAPAAGVDGAGIDTEPPHRQASRAHRRLSAGAAGKTSSAALRPDETQGRGSSYVAELNLQKWRRIIGSSRNKC